MQKNTSVSLTQHHPYVQLHLAKRCLWCPPPRNLYFIMPRMEEGSHWIQTPAWMCYYLTCVITLAKKNLLFTPTSVRRCKRNVCGAPGPNIPLTWTGTAAVWNPRLGGGNGEQHNIKQYWTIMHQCSTSNESNAILHNRFKHAKHEVKLPIPGLINDDNSSFFLKKFCFIQESLNATFYVCWVL